MRDWGLRRPRHLAGVGQPEAPLSQCLDCLCHLRTPESQILVNAEDCAPFCIPGKVQREIDGRVSLETRKTAVSETRPGVKKSKTDCLKVELMLLRSAFWRTQVRNSFPDRYHSLP